MITWVTIHYRESHISRREVVGLFFAVARATTDCEEVRRQREGLATFKIYGHYNRVIETTLNRRITDLDPLAEVRINGQSYAARGEL
ncbi:hypothetical protein GCM10023185_43260 [Hymenobacter saemangeumensis]|uniref:Uncharacterized protein n=1 Tax=Hymenobacter saemangeumensis TaxID=1084522 RepID=A0ABP8ISQ2_9BACT